MTQTRCFLLRSAAVLCVCCFFWFLRGVSNYLTAALREETGLAAFQGYRVEVVETWWTCKIKPSSKNTIPWYTMKGCSFPCSTFQWKLGRPFNQPLILGVFASDGEASSVCFVGLLNRPGFFPVNVEGRFLFRAGLCDLCAGRRVTSFGWWFGYFWKGLNPRMNDEAMNAIDVHSQLFTPPLYVAFAWNAFKAQLIFGVASATFERDLPIKPYQTH